MFLDESEIVAKINMGDEAGLKKLFDLYYKPLCVFALNFIDSYEEAEDMVQELFVKFWERRDKLLFEGSLKAYLFSAVQHNCLKLQKNKQRFKFDEIGDYGEILEDYSPEEMEDEQIRLREEIEKLPEQCRKVFEAVVLRDMKYKEAAELLGISVNTVKTHLARALKQLRNSLNTIVVVLLR